MGRIVRGLMTEYDTLTGHLYDRSGPTPQINGSPSAGVPLDCEADPWGIAVDWLQRALRAAGKHPSLAASMRPPTGQSRRARLFSALHVFDKASGIFGELSSRNEEDLRCELARFWMAAADVHWRTGDAPGAAELFGAAEKELDSTVTQAGNSDEVREAKLECLDGRGQVLRDMGRLYDSLLVHEKQEALSRELHRRAELARALNGKGRVVYALGKLDLAETIHKEQLTLCDSIGYAEGKAKALNNLGRIANARGDYDGMERRFLGCERICRDTNNLELLAISLSNLGALLLARRRLDEALTYLKEAENVSRRLCLDYSLAFALANKGGLYQHWGWLEKALQMSYEALRLAERMDNKEAMRGGLKALAHALEDLERTEEALEVYVRLEELCMATSYHRELVATFQRHACLLRKQGRLEEGRALDLRAKDFISLKSVVPGLIPPSSEASIAGAMTEEVTGAMSERRE
jgi:tetratricopeptide (TPR) repeat protein